MIDLRNYIAPQGTNLRGDIWVIAGPWERISNQCAISFPDNAGTNVMIKVENFSYLTHSGSITVTINLRTPYFCDIEISGKVDGNPVREAAYNIPYSPQGNKLMISWSKYPLTIFKYNGKDETEIDIGNIPILNNVSFWIGK
jgi:hypothetical protein